MIVLIVLLACAFLLIDAIVQAKRFEEEMAEYARRNGR